MAQVTVKINGYAYTLGCEDGQEQHLQDMARQVEQRIESIKLIGGSPSGEGRLLVLAALLMADELHDGAIELARAQSGPLPTSIPKALVVERVDARVNERLTLLARKAEDIAAGLDQA